MSLSVSSSSIRKRDTMVTLRRTNVIRLLKEEHGRHYIREGVLSSSKFPAT